MTINANARTLEWTLRRLALAYHALDAFQGEVSPEDAEEIEGMLSDLRRYVIIEGPEPRAAGAGTPSSNRPTRGR